MTYLFSNPDTKKWKRLFIVSFFLNIVLITAMIVGSVEKDSREINREKEKALSPSKETADSDVYADEYSSEKLAGSEKKQGDTHVITMEIEGSFYGSFSADEKIMELSEKTGIEILHDILAAQISRVLSWGFKLSRDVRKGDKLTFAFRVNSEEEILSRKDLAEVTEILAVKYYSGKNRNEISAYLYEDEENAGYYYENGKRVEKDLVPSPIKNYIQITEVFKGRSGGHKGVDFKAPVGVPVYAAADGVVKRTNWQTIYNGYCIDIKVKGRPYRLKYLHLSDILVKNGDRVNAGDHIANSGNTGRVTGPHLHYQVDRERDGRSMDPYEFHDSKRRKLTEKHMKTFKNRVEQYNAVLASDS
ncbi:MAG: M23 family metallopeptidase [bacterium]